MKKLLLITSLAFICSIISGQDRIIRNDGTKLDCRITGIDNSKVYCIVNIDGYNIKREIERKDIKGLLFEVDLTDTNEEKVLSKRISTTANAANESKKKENISSEREKKIKNKPDDAFADNENHWFLTGGFTFSALKGDSEYLAEGFSRLPRPFTINIGIGIYKNLKPGLTIQYGIVYMPKGMYFNNSENLEKIIYRINYLEIPVAIRISPESWQKSDSKSSYINGGFSLALNTSSTYKYKISNTGVYTSKKETDKGAFNGIKKADINYFIGYGIKKNRCGFELNYEAGMLDIMDKDISAVTLYNRSLSFNFIYYL